MARPLQRNDFVIYYETTPEPSAPSPTVNGIALWNNRNYDPVTQHESTLRGLKWEFILSPTPGLDPDVTSTMDSGQFVKWMIYLERDLYGGGPRAPSNILGTTLFPGSGNEMVCSGMLAVDRCARRPLGIHWPDTISGAYDINACPVAAPAGTGAFGPSLGNLIGLSQSASVGTAMPTGVSNTIMRIKGESKTRKRIPAGAKLMFSMEFLVTDTVLVTGHSLTGTVTQWHDF